MISAQLRKSFFFNLSSSFLRESHLSLYFFSSSSETIASPVSSNFPPSKNPKNVELIALFLKDNGFSDTQLEKLFEKKKTLHVAQLEKSIKPKLKIFHDFGLSISETAEILTKQPAIFHYSAVNRVYPSLFMLRELLGPQYQLIKVLRKTDWFFSTNLKRNLYPNIEFLKNKGADIKRIVRLLSLYPRTLLCPPKTIREVVEKLVNLGVDLTSNVFIYCLWVRASMSNKVWDIKMETFRELGFTEDETLNMFRKLPLVLTVSPEKIKKNAEAILATNKYTILSIKYNPMALTFSLDKRLKPRFRVFKILEKKKLIEKWPNLSVVYELTDERFHEYFVAPYPQVRNQLSDWKMSK